MAERGGLVFMLIWLFGLWITTFLQAVGVRIEHMETAVQIATLCFWFSLVFCGILLSLNDLPRFWIVVYRASPLTYFIDGMVLASLANTHLECSNVQLLHINPPLVGLSNLTCAEYLRRFAQYTNRVLKNPAAMTDCLYCPVNETNILLRQLDLGTEYAWSNVGYITVYVLFNAFAIYFIYWLTRVPKS
ncbi:ATP-dependent permease PDR10, partial [Lachnellula cervina]